MAELGKSPGSIISDTRNVFPILRTRRTKIIACAFIFAFVACTSIASHSSSAPYRSHFSSFFSHFFSNLSSSSSNLSLSDATNAQITPTQQSLERIQALSPTNQAEKGIMALNQTKERSGSQGIGVSDNNETRGGVAVAVKREVSGALSNKNHSNGIAAHAMKGTDSMKNETKEGFSAEGAVVGSATAERNVIASKQEGVVGGGDKGSNLSVSLVKGNESLAGIAVSDGDPRRDEWDVESMVGCDIFEGRWVRDESYPLYEEGSCPHIDEPFNCFLNGRPDRAYQKLRWLPNGCNIPRLNATDMLERLRGKRLVFIGDSLNRNMWESLVCILRNSIKDKRKVFEASGRHEFRTDGSYSFLFKDYNCTVEFFRSPFLVQEWEMPETEGNKKETLRLDIIERSSSKYKDANIIIFNTGHWWTHEKTARGKDYYQEGDQVYDELNVVEAFRKALRTWAKWIDANVSPHKTLVFFRGYSASHFSGGQWNSGGQCHKEMEPIKNETYLSAYPSMMRVLESVIKGMKTPVSYLNITRMTDYRKDAHPSIYRKQILTEEERRSPEMYQDCSHWCMPGVADSWNELLYAQLLIKQHLAS